MSKLTIQEQIDVLKRGKEIYMSGSYYGMCLCISDAIFEKCNNDIDIDNIFKYIPTFNMFHIFKMAKGTELEPKVLAIFWWDMRDRTIRPQIFDMLINELEGMF